MDSLFERRYSSARRLMAQLDIDLLLVNNRENLIYFTGLTDIEDVVPFIRHLVSDGWWITGQTILINGGYTTK